jgi:hypothetical protein
MKKTGLLLVFVASLVAAQSSVSSTQPATPDASGIVATSSNVPFVRYMTPTNADLYCAGFISKQALPNANFVTGGMETPFATKFETGDVVYLTGTGYQVGQLYSIVRELRDVNEYEMFEGQKKAIAAAGHPYGEIGRVRVLDMRSHGAIGQVVFNCDPVNPGDVAVPFVEKHPIAFHPPGHFDRFAPASGKLTGRILMAKDFDGIIGTGMKIYMNMGSNQGVKVGDYYRVVRSYSAMLKDPVDRLSFLAQGSEDTQLYPPTYESNFFNRSGWGKGPNIHVTDLPRRAVGEVVILSTTPTTSSGMVVFTLENILTGDNVQLDEQQQ